MKSALVTKKGGEQEIIGKNDRYDERYRVNVIQPAGRVQHWEK